MLRLPSTRAGGSLCRVAVLGLVLVALSGCGFAPQPEASARPAPPTAAALLDWMTNRTASCREEDPAQVGTRRWACTIDMAAANASNATDRTVFSTQIDATDLEVRSITASVDERRGTSSGGPGECQVVACDPIFEGFFVDTIAKAPITGTFGDAIGAWIQAHVKTGGASRFGPISLSMTVASSPATLTLTFAPGSSPEPRAT